MLFVIVIVLVHGSLMVHAVGLLLLLLVRSINRINTGLDCRSLPIVPRHFVMNSTGLTPGSLTDCSSMLIVIVLID